MSDFARIAAVDCGTNSLRLLIGERHPTGPRKLRRITRIVGLGRGVDRTGKITNEAMERALTVLDEYCVYLKEARVEKVSMVATSASRDALNSQVFLDKARRRLKSVCSESDVRVISGTEEAELSFAGATASRGKQNDSLREDSGLCIVIDVGGGSTEIAIGKQGKIKESVSLTMGCVRWTERFIDHDPPHESEIWQMRNCARTTLKTLSDSQEMASALSQARTAIAVAGTALTTAAVSLNHSSLDPEHLSRAAIPFSEIIHTAQYMSTLSIEQRTSLGAIDPNRAAVIPCGSWILAEIAAFLQLHTPIRELWVREEDILDGILERL